MPQILFNQKQYTRNRKELRNTSPPAERLLWGYIKNKQIIGHKFRRQFGIGRYVVDFYCPKLRLVIEVDGDIHFQGSAERSDAARQRFIESLGLKVLRFLNTDVYKNIDGVVLTIQKTVEELTATAPFPPPPRGGAIA